MREKSFSPMLVKRTVFKIWTNFSKKLLKFFWKTHNCLLHMIHYHHYYISKLFSYQETCDQIPKILRQKSRTSSTRTGLIGVRSQSFDHSLRGIRNPWSAKIREWPCGFPKKSPTPFIDPLRLFYYNHPRPSNHSTSNSDPKKHEHSADLAQRIHSECRPRTS